MSPFSIPQFAMFAIASFGVSALAQSSFSTPDFGVSGSLHDARVVHTATLLRDGRVLVAGGGQGLYTTEGYDNVPGAELFDPVSGSFAPAGTFARQYHTGTLLPSGKSCSQVERRILIPQRQNRNSTIRSLDNFKRPGAWLSLGKPTLRPYCKTAAS